jgi:hypothetical protein
VLTSNPIVDVLLAVQVVVLAALPLVGNLLLLGVAAVRARHVPGSGWLFLLAAAILGLVQGLLAPAGGFVVSLLGARLGVTAMMGLNAGVSVLGAVVSLVWWGLLVAGIAALCATRAPGRADR